MKKGYLAILGAGNMGTALAVAAAKKNYVIIWSIEPDVVEAINKKRENPRYLAGVKLPKNISATGDLKKAVSGASLILVAVPSQVVPSLGRSLGKLVKKNQLIVNIAKGVHPKTLEPVVLTLGRALPAALRPQLATLSGPSIANEFSRGLPCAVVVAAKKLETAEAAARYLRTDQFRIITSTDIIGTALGGTLKNVYALALGMVDGLKLGLNAKATLLTAALAEMRSILKSLGAEEKSAYALSGIGDLVVTGTSEHSRNRGFGEALCLDARSRVKMKDPTQTIEGVKAVQSLAPFMRRKKIKAPILFSIERVLFKNQNPKSEIAKIFKNI